MCGRYAVPDEAAVERLCAADSRRGFSWMRPLFNGAPATQVPIIVQARDGALEIQGARWGLIPPWWQKDTPPALTFNARSEDAAEKPVWREGLKATRCLLPALGWYEWNADQLVSGKAGRKGGQPYFISCPGSEVIAFAGIWAVWTRPGVEPVVSCGLLTRKAAPVIEFIHPRMPVVLKPGQLARWLDPAATLDGIAAMISGAREDFASHPVSTRVNNARNDSPDLLARVSLHTTDPLNFGGSGTR